MRYQVYPIENDGRVHLNKTQLIGESNELPIAKLIAETFGAGIMDAATGALIYLAIPQSTTVNDGDQIIETEELKIVAVGKIEEPSNMMVVHFNRHLSNNEWEAFKRYAWGWNYVIRPKAPESPRSAP